MEKVAFAIAPILRTLLTGYLAHEAGGAIWDRLQGALGGQVMDRVQQTEQKIGEPEKQDNLVKDVLYSYNNLANELASIGVRDSRLTDGASLRRYFKQEGWNLPVTKIAEVVDAIRTLVASMKNAGAAEIDPQFAEHTVKFAFDYFKKFRYDIKLLNTKLAEMQKMAETPLGIPEVVANINGQYTQALTYKLMRAFGNPGEVLPEIHQMAKEGVIFLGPASGELLSYQYLQDQKLRTSTAYFNKTYDQFMLMMPVAFRKEQFVQNIYGWLSSYFQSDLAKMIVLQPHIQLFYNLTYGVEQGLSRFRSGTGEAMGELR